MTWHLFKPGELHSAVFADPPFLVAPLLPRGGLAMIHGAKTAGKTQLALTLGVAVATGTPFLHDYHCEPGSVVFLEADMPKQMLQYRVADAPETRVLHFAHTGSFDVVRLAGSGALPADVQAVQALQPALLIVDTLRKVHVLDENDSRTPLLVHTAWQRLFPGTALLFIHHDRKKPRDPSTPLISEEAARGTEAWAADIDVSMYLHKHRRIKDSAHTATLGFSKVRYSDDIAPFPVQMRPGSLLIEPIRQTARQMLLAWHAANPTATLQEAVAWLQKSDLCGQSRAYKLVAELDSTRGWKFHTASTIATPSPT